MVPVAGRRIARSMTGLAASPGTDVDPTCSMSQSGPSIALSALSSWTYRCGQSGS